MTAVRDRRALVTGAGHGLGRAIALRLARAGAEVVVTDRDPDRVASVVGELTAAKLRAVGFPLDVTSEDQILAARDRAGSIDVLVNNAGVVFGGEFAAVPMDRHRSTVDVNLVGVLAVTHAFLPGLVERPAAHVVNVVSASAVVGLPWGASYAATKWAVLGFSESLREELRVTGRRHVRVTAVCPSYVETGLFAGARPPRLTWVLAPEAVADATVRAVERNREVVFLPWTVRALVGVSGVLPRPAFRWLCDRLGVATSMAGWRGHGG